MVGWIDAFTRDEYRDILLNSIKYCQENKGLELFAWVLMTNHFHLIIRAKEGFALSDIMRDMKKITSKRIVAAIKENNKESRKEWMLFLFERFGRYNSNNTHFQFWRQDNHPIELFGAKAIQQKLNYIHESPV